MSTQTGINVNPLDQLGPAGTALSGLSSVAPSSLNPFSGLTGGFQNTLGNKGFWIRTGTVALGIMLAWIGILLILASNKEVRGAAVDAAKTAALA